MKIKFYDTSSLLLKANTLFENNELFAISSVTLQELEDIKSNRNKTPDIKAAARYLLTKLDANLGKYEIVIYRESFGERIGQKDLALTNDTKILACAIWLNNRQPYMDDVVFVTNDFALKQFANLFFGTDSIESVREDIDDEYTGFIQVTLDETQLAEFYSDLSNNQFNLLRNQYLLIYNQENTLIDKMKWNGEKYTPISYGNFDSHHFGRVKPYKNDPYQALVSDSFLNNKLTLVKGPAGTGKSYISMAYLFNQLDTHRIDKIIIFCNTIATKGAARLGFYPGTRDEKLLDSQIGNFLSSKLGDRSEVEHLMEQGKLVLLPFSDLRGFDTTGMRAGIYITEAQNLDISLMKLAIQRIGEDCICIIDGDAKAQVDLVDFEGMNNGMRRLSKVFRGKPFFGEVELQSIHRSELAACAELM